MTPADAFVAAVRAAVPGVDVFDTVVPDRPAAVRWVVVYPGNGTPEAFALCGPGEDLETSNLVNCFGPDRQKAAWLSGRIRDYLHTHPVLASGWAPGWAEHDEVDVPPRPDEAVREVPLVICTDTYNMTITKE